MRRVEVDGMLGCLLGRTLITVQALMYISYFVPICRTIYVTYGMIMDRTTSKPKSVLIYALDKVRFLDLETSLSQSCSPK